MNEMRECSFANFLTAFVLFFEPSSLRVMPYMDGWEAVEDEDRNTHGEVDYITQ